MSDFITDSNVKKINAGHGCELARDLNNYSSEMVGSVLDKAASGSNTTFVKDYANQTMSLVNKGQLPLVEFDMKNDRVEASRCTENGKAYDIVPSQPGFSMRGEPSMVFVPAKH